jgi:hypothetical protein
MQYRSIEIIFHFSGFLIGMTSCVCGIVSILSFLAALVFSQPLPSLPVAPIDIPRSLAPPLNHSRVSVHGWLWLPTDELSSSPPSQLSGFFVHHTPEFFKTSPHNFQIVVHGVLQLNQSVRHLPTLPKHSYVRTEYVLSPPQFSLDDLLSHTLRSISGPFSNGSFDTPQRYVLASAKLNFTVVTARYLSSTTTQQFPQPVFTSYVAYPSTDRLYWMHVMQQSPDFDQVLHVALRRCIFRGGDSVKDIVLPSATWAVLGRNNTVGTRLRAGDSIRAALMTAQANGSILQATQCSVVVLEEIHCVTVPDSFTPCG